MNAISNKKLEEVTNNYNEIKKENENLKIELDKLKLRNSMMINNSRRFMGTGEKEIKITGNNVSRSSVGTNEKFPLIENK